MEREKEEVEEEREKDKEEGVGVDEVDGRLEGDAESTAGPVPYPEGTHDERRWDEGERDRVMSAKEEEEGG